MTAIVQIHNGPDDEERTLEALARLFEDPSESWGNLEIAVEFQGGHASIHWTGFDAEQGAVSEGFLVRVAGESPLGDVDSPEIVSLLDGGSEPFDATARHLLRAADACWLAWQLGRNRGARPARWPDGRPIVWSEAIVDEDPWRALGQLEELYEESVVTINCDTVDLALEEPAWLGQRSVVLARRPLTDREAATLPGTAMWQVLRRLDDVDDARWLALLREHPMPWLRTLTITLDRLDGLAGAVGRQPRLRELLVYSRAEVVPAIASDSLEGLLIEGMQGPAIAAFLAGSRLPALRVLVVFSEAIAAPIDVSGLGAGVVVHVELMVPAELALLRNTRGARTLALALTAEHAAEDVVRELAARAELTTWVSSLWPHAQEAAALAQARGIRLEVR